jgi:hypothetical protein
MMNEFFNGPVAGIHPLVWLAVFLIFGPPAIFSKTAAEKFGFFGAAARHVRGRQRRKIIQERDRIIEEHAMADVAYSQLKTQVDRLARQIEDQDKRHKNEMKSLRDEIDNERMRFTETITQLRINQEVWEDYGDWVSMWAAEQLAHMARHGIQPQPPPFRSFYEYKKRNTTKSP